MSSLRMAPGMGLNAFFAYSLVMAGKISWQTALGVVFLSGLFFLVLTLVDHIGLVTARHKGPDAVKHIHKHQTEYTSEEAPLKRPKDVEMKGNCLYVKVQRDEFFRLFDVSEHGG